MGSVVGLNEHHLIFVCIIEVVSTIPHDRPMKHSIPRLDYCPIAWLCDHLGASEPELRVRRIPPGNKDRRIVDGDADGLFHTGFEGPLPEWRRRDTLGEVDVLKFNWSVTKLAVIVQTTHVTCILAPLYYTVVTD
jgi:hypothetical protein